MSISVIIAAYNEEKYITSCLQALLPQLQSGDEIIVVDNNSTDNTVLLCNTFGVKIIQEKQQGMSFARNTGFRMAKNTILARTDADTIVCSNWLDTIRNYYLNAKGEHDLTAITGPVYVRNFLLLKLRLHQGKSNKALNHETLVGSNEALTQNLWSKIDYKLSNNDALYMEDVEMAHVITQHAGGVEFVPEMIVYTSGRWMIRQPIRSIRTWKYKMKNTKRLLRL